MQFNQNLKVVGNKVISYTTHVATIQDNKLIVHGRWSTTTSKHINMVAKEYDLEKVDGDKPSEDGPADSMLKTTGIVAMLGEIFGTTQKEKNDWKARMLKAGLENRGLIMPDDWDTLSEDEKTRRLNKVIEIATK